MLIISDSLLQNFKTNYIVECFPGMTLYHFVNNLMLCYNNKETTIICFGTNDLHQGILKHEIIKMYKKVSEYFTNVYIILPPLQCKLFYDDCINKLPGVNFISIFSKNYKTVDNLHPNNITLNKLNKWLDVNFTE